MATPYYWVAGGTGNWSSATNWSATDGGASGAGPPTTGDDAFFTVNSGAGTATMSANFSLRNLDFTGFVGTWGGAGTLTMTGSTFKLATGMTRTFTGAITFANTSGTLAITCNGITLDNGVTFNGVGGTFQFQDDFINSTGHGIVHTDGVLDTNGKNVAGASFASTSATTRTLTMTNSTWTISGTSGNPWNTNVTTGLTLNASGSLIKFTNSTSTGITMLFGPTGITYGDIELAGTGSGTLTLASSTGTLAARHITVSNSNGATLTESGNVHLSGNLTFNSGYTGLWSGLATFSIDGNLTLSSTQTVTRTGLLTFARTSGTTSITSNGVTIDAVVTINTVGATVQLADAFTMGTTRTLTLTAGTFDTNAKAVSVGIFLSNNANVRTFTITNSTITVVGSGTAWNMNPASNVTMNITGSTVIFDNSADSNNRTVAIGVAANALNDVYFQGTGSGNFDASTFIARDIFVTATGGGSFKGTAQSRTLDFTGFTGAWAGTSTINISGSLKLVTGMSIAGAMTSPIVFNDTSGSTRTITTAGKTLLGTLTFNGVGGVWNLADALTLSSTITLTNGALSTLGFAVQCTAFSGSNANVRTLDITNTTFTLTPTTITNSWSLSTSTNLTFVSTGSRIVFRGSSTGNNGFLAGGLTYNDVEYAGTSADNWLWSGSPPTFRDVFVTNHTGTWLSNVSFICRHLNFTGFTGTWSGTNAASMTGDLTFSASMTRSNTGAIAMNGSGTQTITSNGIGLGGTLTVNSTGTVQLADAFNATVPVTAAFIFQSGTFNTNNFAMTITAAGLGPISATTRVLNLGSSVVTLTGGAGTVWNCAISPGTLTVNAGTSSIVLSTASSSNTLFDGAGFTYYNLTFGTGAGTGTFQLVGSSTYHNVTLTGAPRTLLITSNTTNVVNDLIALGTVSNLFTIKGATAGTKATLSKPNNNTTQIDWTHFQDLKFTGGARWFLGQHAVNDGGTVGGRYAGSSDRYSAGDTPFAA
jgi:hypothetical protein